MHEVLISRQVTLDESDSELLSIKIVKRFSVEVSIQAILQRWRPLLLSTSAKPRVDTTFHQLQYQKP